MTARTVVKLTISNNSRFFSDVSVGSLPPMTTINNEITSYTLNKLLLKQQVSITQERLNKLLKIKGVSFELPFSPETIIVYYALVGRPKTRGIKSGVYIFTHIKSGSMYVGSSNSISRRLDQYFNPNSLFKQSGLLPLLIEKEGFASFSLEIYIMPEELTKDYSYLFLEQYYLLQEKFNLNTQRIVNFRVKQGKRIYMYDKDCKILYYSSNSVTELKGVLGIHPATTNKCLKLESLYLNQFVINDKLITDAKKADLSLIELNNLISEKKKLLVKSFSKVTSKPICIK